MDYKNGTELWMHQWKSVQDPEHVWLSFLEGKKEGEMVAKKDSITSNANILKLLYDMRVANVKQDTIVNMAKWRKINQVNFPSFTINSLNITLSNIHFKVIGDTSNVSVWKIVPSQKNIETIIQHPDTTITTGTFVKYGFNQLNASTNTLEILVNTVDTLNFNKYLYPQAPNDSVKLGDPKANPTVPTTSSNAYYGYFGCTRYDANVTCSYPDALTYSGKNKKHDGVDIKTVVGENVYAIYGGVVQTIVNSFEPQNETYANADNQDYRGIYSTHLVK